MNRGPKSIDWDEYYSLNLSCVEFEPVLDYMAETQRQKRFEKMRERILLAGSLLGKTVTGRILEFSRLNNWGISKESLGRVSVEGKDLPAATRQQEALSKDKDGIDTLRQSSDLLYVE